MNPKRQKERKEARIKVLSEIIGKGISFKINSNHSKTSTEFIESYMYDIVNGMSKKVEKIQKKYEGLDAFAIYEKQTKDIIRSILEEYDYPEKDTPEYKESQELINERHDEVSDEMHERQTRISEATYLTNMDIDEHLKEMMELYPERFTITIKYNPND